MRYPKFFGVLVLALMLSITSYATAYADHYEYCNRNSACQVGGGNGWPEHWSYNKWYIYSPYYPHNANDPINSVVWKAQSVNLENVVQSAITAWTGYFNTYGVHWIVFKDVTGNPTGYVIDLEATDSVACPAGELGCFIVNSFQGATPSNANRLLKATLRVDWFANWYDANQRQAAVAHELGHAFNLDERFDDDGTGGCGSENTIMDTVYQNGSGQWIFCDNITGPTGVDGARIENEYVKGECTSAGTPQQSGDHLLSFWFDQAYENWSHNLNFFKKNGGGWDWKGIGDEISLVGTEYGTVSRVIINTRLNVKPAWGSGTYYVSCRPRFGTKNDGTVIFGLTSDSPSVNIN